MVDLALTYTQSNDAIRIVLTDDTGDYAAGSNTGGWGTPNPATTEVVATTSSAVGYYHLCITATIETSSGVSTTYDEIDLYTEFTAQFAESSGMVFELTPDMFVFSGTALGAVTDQFPDGAYTITYFLREADTSTISDSVEYVYLVDGIVRETLYGLLADVSDVYDSQVFNAAENEWQDLLDLLFKYTYFQGMLSNPEIAEKDKKLEILYTLENLLNE